MEKKPITGILPLLFSSCILFVSLFAIMDAQFTYAQQQTNFKTYDSSIANFEINYPDNWKIKQIQDDDKVPAEKGLEAFVEFDSQAKTNIPLPSESDLGFKLPKAVKDALKNLPEAYLRIYVSQTPRHLDTDTMKVKFNSTSDEYAQFLKDWESLSYFLGGRKVNSGDIELNGNKTHAYTMDEITSKDGKDQNYISHIIFNLPDNSITYEIEYGADVLKIPDYLPIFKNMTNSFKFLNETMKTNS